MSKRYIEQWSGHSKVRLRGRHEWQYYNPDRIWLWQNIEQPVLDVGCGSAIDGEFFIDYVGCDVTKESLRSAHEKYNVENVVCCDARFLPFKPNVFKSVFSKDLLLHYPQEEGEKVIREMLRLKDEVVVAWGIEKDGTNYKPSYNPDFKMKDGFYYNKYDLEKLEKEFLLEFVENTSITLVKQK